MRTKYLQAVDRFIFSLLIFCIPGLVGLFSFNFDDPSDSYMTFISSAHALCFPQEA